MAKDQRKNHFHVRSNIKGTLNLNTNKDIIVTNTNISRIICYLPIFRMILFRYIVQVIDEEQVEGDSVTVNQDAGQTPPIEAQDVRYVHLPGGESVIQISIDGNTTLMLPCDKN